MQYKKPRNAKERMEFLLSLVNGAKSIEDYVDHGPTKCVKVELDGPNHYKVAGHTVTAEQYFLMHRKSVNTKYILILRGDRHLSSPSQQELIHQANCARYGDNTYDGRLIKIPKKK